MTIVDFKENAQGINTMTPKVKFVDTNTSSTASDSAFTTNWFSCLYTFLYIEPDDWCVSAHW